MNSMRMDAPFACIVGAPRSGTTWLHAMLGSHPQVCTTHELKLFDLFTGPWERAWQDLVEIQQIEGAGRRGLRIVWSDDEFYDYLSRLVTDVYTRVLAGKPGSVLVLDKSPGYSRFVRHIDRLIPQVRFIHMLRDGRDVAVSLRAASRDWARTWAPASIVAGAELWRSMVLAAREARSVAPERYLELHFETLLRNGPQVLQEVFSFMGISVSAEEATRIYEAHTLDRMRSESDPFDLPAAFFRTGQSGGWRNELTVRERYLFDDAAGDLLRDLGYDGDDWWPTRRFHRWLVPALAAPGARRYARALAVRLASHLNLRSA